MHIHQLGIQLGGGLRGGDLTPAGLHGVFYDVMGRYDGGVATWLHEHRAPKPYTLNFAHYDRQRREVAGIVINALSEPAAEAIVAAFHHVYDERSLLTIGRQSCFVSDIIPVDATSFQTLCQAPPRKRVGMVFLTPTAFKQGHGELLFPLPYNVFGRPYHVWQRYAPERYRLPDDWLDWCAQTVFAIRHNVRTVQKNINRSKRFVGFVGQAYFAVRHDREADPRQTKIYNSVLHALGLFATFSGVGARTTMGMGAVEVIDDSR